MPYLQNMPRNYFPEDLSERNRFNLVWDEGEYLSPQQSRFTLKITVFLIHGQRRNEGPERLAEKINKENHWSNTTPDQRRTIVGERKADAINWWEE